LGLGDAALARLAAAEHGSCAPAWRALRALARSERARVLAGWIVEVKAPFPPGMERLHPSWIADAIASEPKDLWSVLLSGLPGAEGVSALLGRGVGPITGVGQEWLSESVADVQRCVFARLAPLCVAPSGPVGAGLCRLGCEELLAEVMRRGSATVRDRPEGQADSERLRAEGLAGLRDELGREGDASLWAVAGRLPVALGRPWVKW